MFESADFKSRFATPLRFAPTLKTLSLTQVLAALGLVAVGIGLGAGLAPVIRRWNEERGMKPRRSAPIQEIDRWANEGGAVVAPAFQKLT